MILKSDDDGIPLDAPSPKDLRIMGLYLTSLYPLDEFLTLTVAKDYEASQQLAGVHEAIRALNDLAEKMDERNERITLESGL